MKITLSFIFFLFILTTRLSAQLIGLDSVCSGNIYTYTVNIPGTDSVSWTLPSGWVLISSSGNQINVLCNVNVGTICGNAFDSFGASLGQQCKTISWGGSGMNWHADALQMQPCQCPLFAIGIVSDGTGGCGTCTGTPSPNLLFAVYDHVWPATASNFIVEADGVSTFHLPYTPSTYYVYLIDITFGLQNAILIEGGLCPGPNNNAVSIPACMYANLGINQTPNPACYGDTVTFQYNGTGGPVVGPPFTWQVNSGHSTLFPPFNLDHIQCIIDSGTNITVDIHTTGSGCNYAGSQNVNIITCSTALPVASFVPDETEFCEGNCTNFQNTSLNSSTFYWTFPGGTPSTSSAASPATICYNIPGTYDVKLVATNAAGSDSIVHSNYITINPTPVATLTIMGDTLIATSGFLHYHWYLGNTLLPLVTGNEYVTTQTGNYSVVVTNAFTCTDSVSVFHVITGIDSPENELRDIYFDQEEKRIIISGEEIIAVQLFDLSGRVVANSNQRIISTDGLASGLYTLRILKGKMVLQRKIFIK